MIRNIDVNKLLLSDLLVPEPVDSIISDIDASSRKKIILAGSRGSGRSVLLGRKESKSIGSIEPAFLAQFDAAGLFGKNESEYFTKEFIKHYYEVIMSRKFLHYVRTYYPEVFYFKGFSKYSDLNEKHTREIDKYIDSSDYKKIELEQVLSSGEFVGELLALFKENTGVDGVTLLVDRFDWTHSGDPRIQTILKKYFNIFSKAIITTDDPKVLYEDRIWSLGQKGYDVLQVEYGKDIDVIHDMVDRRFSVDKEIKKKNTAFPVDQITDMDYKKLISRSDGNINVILDSIAATERRFNINNMFADIDNDFDMSRTLEELCCEKMVIVKKIASMKKASKLNL